MISLTFITILDICRPIIQVWSTEIIFGNTVSNLFATIPAKAI